MTFIIIFIALIIDQLFGEVKKWHPLAGFGLLANKVEAIFRLSNNDDIFKQRLRGVVSLFLITAPFVLVCYFLTSIPELALVLNIIILYFAIGAKSLKQHAQNIYRPLKENNIAQAKSKTQLIVSRDTKNMTENDISKAAIESVLENGNDAIFGALFWFLIAGAPGVILFRLVNTLDAMWGYRNERFLHFGWAAAKLDDVMNYIPARLTALSYACAGTFSKSTFGKGTFTKNMSTNEVLKTVFLKAESLETTQFKNAIFCWRTQSPEWDSPNAGPVMAAGAGALSIKLGGTATYQQQIHHRPTLGSDNAAKADDINNAITLVDHSIILWLFVIASISFAGAYFA
ncbi:MAG: adenosylcobinamide-phosphate synthase CbiB [Gammaproteobacteria bacterium]|nr:adenosylcobinamide-phosphate synthase CbiB [Gammaproteobacteria bacterium]